MYNWQWSDHPVFCLHYFSESIVLHTILAPLPTRSGSTCTMNDNAGYSSEWQFSLKSHFTLLHYAVECHLYHYLPWHRLHAASSIYKLMLLIDFLLTISSNAAESMCPLLQQKWSGVFPLMSCGLTSAPFSSSFITTCRQHKSIALFLLFLSWGWVQRLKVFNNCKLGSKINFQFS